MTEHHVASKTFGRYIILHTIGKGEFGKVKLAYDPQKDIEVAIKFIKRSNITSAQKQAKLEREINILQNLDHPNIVRLFDVIETEKYIGIVMAYANGGELFEYISENQYLSEEESAKFFIQLLDGVQYLHSRHIVHRDLKLENLLLDQKGDIIITDFGFANNSRKNPSGLLSTSCGSPCYAAPELVINDNYIGEAADIWSCGIILYAMLCGYLPFDDDPNNPDGENLDLLYKYILESQLTFPDYVSEDAQELVCGMLIPDPEKRWSMDKVINHRWLRNSSYGKKRLNESMKSDYMYDNSYMNESSNSEIENVQEGKVPQNNDETEHTEVYEARNTSCSENVDTSLDKTEYIQNQDASKDAVVPNETNTSVIVDSVVPEVEKQQSISQTSSEQEFLDAQQELSMEITKDQEDPMEVEEDAMEIDESLNNKEDQCKIEEERQNAEKQIEKLISEIQQEEFTQLEEMKDQLQEVVAEKAEERVSPKENVSDMIEEVKEQVTDPEVIAETEKIEEAKEEVTVPEVVTETEKVEEAKEVTVPETVTEKVEETKDVTIPENVTEQVEEIKEVAVPETVTEKVEEVKEEVTVPENVTEKVEETKEEIVVPETVDEKIEEVKEEVASIPEVATIKVEEDEETKEDEVKNEEKVESPSTIKLEKEDLIEVDDKVKENSSNSSIETEKESVEIKEEKKDAEKEQEKPQNVTEDVEMKEQDDSKESEITTMEEEEVGMLRKRKQKKAKKDKLKIKKGKKEIRKNEKAKNKKNIKVKIKENKMFRAFFGCVMKDPTTKEH